MAMHARLFPAKQPRKAPTEQVYDVTPHDVLPASTSDPRSWRLGELDVAFAPGHRPTIVELLTLVPAKLDPDRFAAALKFSLNQFAVACGRRLGHVVTAGPGLRFSAIRVRDEQLSTRPPPAALFDSPWSAGDQSTAQGASVLTVRLSNGEQLCGVGICFDHALCDVCGPALLLAHISAHYAQKVALPPSPHHDRQLQSRINNRREVGARVEPSHAVAGPGRAAVPKGGCACVEWSYTASRLVQLKAGYRAHSRHDAVFADVLMLLRCAMPAATLTTATVSRDDRVRCGVPAEHFG
jgi:hypothetical protein